MIYTHRVEQLFINAASMFLSDTLSDCRREVQKRYCYKKDKTSCYLGILDLFKAFKSSYVYILERNGPSVLQAVDQSLFVIEPLLEPIPIYCHLDLQYENLTQWGGDKMAAILQTAVRKTFCLMEICEFRLKFHWNLFLRVLLTTFQHWFR